MYKIFLISIFTKTSNLYLVYTINLVSLVQDDNQKLIISNNYSIYYNSL